MSIGFGILVDTGVISLNGMGFDKLVSTGISKHVKEQPRRRRRQQCEVCELGTHSHVDPTQILNRIMLNFKWMQRSDS
jgi:hypothetical protein